MTLSSAWVTMGPLCRIEGTLPAHAERMIGNAGAFEHQGQWFCKEAVAQRVLAALRASGVTVRVDEAGVVHRASLGLQQGGTGIINGVLPRKVDKTWLGRSQGRALVGITPYALQDVMDAMVAGGIEVTADKPAKAMMSDMEDLSANIIHALHMAESDLPDVKLLTGALRPYQRRALAFGDACNGRFYVAFAPGLGKTLVAIAWSLHSKASRNVIICPGAVKRQWCDEIAKFAGGSTYIMEGTSRSPIPAGVKWVVVNPDIIHSRYEDLAAYNAEVLVLDEAHRQKTGTAKRVEALNHLGKQAKMYVALSGTPVENVPINLWVQLDIAQPRWWGTYWDFGMAFCKPERNHWASTRAGFNIYDYKGVSQDSKEVLKDRLRHVMLRRSAEDVKLELPAQTRTMVRVALEGAARREYDGLVREYKDFVQEAMKGAETKEQKDRALSAVRSQRAAYAMKLRQCSSRVRIPDTVELVADLVESGERPIVFAWFRDTLEALAVALKKEKLTVSLIHGGTSKREDVIQAFQDGKSDVLVAQVEVGGVGLNFQHASRITVTHELSYVPIHIPQSEGRVHRMGQSRPTLHYYILGEDTMDERVLDILMRKISAGKEMLEESETGTEDEILRRLEAEFFGAK